MTRLNLNGQWRPLLHHDNRFFSTRFSLYLQNDVQFQKDGTTCHTSHATIDLLCQTLDGHLISGNGKVNWPQRFDAVEIFKPRHHISLK